VGNLVVAGIRNVNDAAEVSADDVIDVLWNDANKLTEVFDAFQNSMPKEQKKGN
jgi:hypothetical protein